MLEQLVLFLVMVYVKHFHIDVELFLTKQKFLLCIYNLALWLCLYNCDTMVYVSVEVETRYSSSASLFNSCDVQNEEEATIFFVNFMNHHQSTSHTREHTHAQKRNGQHMTDRALCLLNILNYWYTTPQSIDFLYTKWLKIRLPELSTTPPKKTGSLVLSLVDNLFIQLARWWASWPWVQTRSGRSTWSQVLPKTCLALATPGMLQTRLNASLSELLWKSANCRFRRLPTQLTQDTWQDNLCWNTLKISFGSSLFFFCLQVRNMQDIYKDCFQWMKIKYL